jgi:hypothetical protein
MHLFGCAGFWLLLLCGGGGSVAGRHGSYRSREVPGGGGSSRRQPDHELDWIARSVKDRAHDDDDVVTHVSSSAPFFDTISTFGTVHKLHTKSDVKT